MDERVTIPISADLLDWLKAEAKRRARPVAFIAREALERDRLRREAQENVAA